MGLGKQSSQGVVKGADQRVSVIHNAIVSELWKRCLFKVNFKKIKMSIKVLILIKLTSIGNETEINMLHCNNP